MRLLEAERGLEALLDVREVRKRDAPLERLVGHAQVREPALDDEGGDHGDGSDVDGRGGQLAHAFFPTDGRLHFDEAEQWTNNIGNILSLPLVASINW